MRRASVRIRSAIHPEGKLYEFRAAADLTDGERAELAELHRDAAALMARRWKSPAAKIRMARLIEHAVEVLLPGIEPRLLRRMPDESCRLVLSTWASIEGGGS